jgi:hypothetical protein
MIADVMGMTIGPAEDHSPLIVASDRKEFVEIAFELLQAVGWRHPQVLEPGGGVHRLELALGASRDAAEVPDDLIGEPAFRLSVAEDLIIRVHTASRDAVNITGGAAADVQLADR